MKPSIYIETSIISYLTSRPSRDLVIAAHQQLTQEWWEARKLDFELCVSEMVFQESASGDPTEANKRLSLIRNLRRLELNADALELARRLLEKGPLPPKAAIDALHIAIATVHEMDYLLTWNCRHIANAEMRAPIIKVCQAQGYECPIICTPEESIGEKFL